MTAIWAIGVDDDDHDDHVDYENLYIPLLPDKLLNNAGQLNCRF